MISLRRFLHNLYRHFVYDEIDVFGSKEDVKKLKDEVSCLKHQLDDQKLINKIIVDCMEKRELSCTAELKYLIDNGFSNFPYVQIKRCPIPLSGFDDINKLPFVCHNGKRLYFSSDYTSETAAEMYRYYIEKENLLGGNYTEKAPHQYQTEMFKVEEGDVLVDMGCAEALLSLDVIEKVKHVYLIEGDKKWIPALEATFAPYIHKVTIINKFVDDADSDESIRLRDILQNEIGNSIFIKMDVEGAEVKVLNDSKDCLKDRKNTKIVCCTYHYNGDYEKITGILDDINYSWTASDGVMLFSCYDKPVSPFYRTGLEM